MFFSVIIPTCQRNDLLTLCLERLAPGAQTLASDQYEVIVTDDGRSETARILIETTFPWATWVEGPHKGPAANRNNGARHARTEWLVFTDDDCLPQNNWLQQYYEAIPQHPGVAAFEGAILPDKEEDLTKPFAECPVNTSGTLFWSANIAISKQLFAKIGGFDEGYLLAAQEDQQIYLDLQPHTQIPFLRQSIVVHPVRYSSLWLQLKRINIRSANFLRYARKNKGSLAYSSTWQFAKEQYGFHVLTFINSVRAKKFQESAVSLAWVLWGVPLNIWRFIK